MSFDGGNQLSFGGRFCFGAADSIDIAPVSEFPLSESAMMRILEGTVTRAACEEDGTLILNFSNGDLLAVYANDPQYEAYELRIDGSEYIV